MKVDLTKEHSVYLGVMENGARYKQKGRLFKADGELVDPNDEPKEVDYKKMPTGKVKTLVEALDEPYTNKEEGVILLKASGYSE